MSSRTHLARFLEARLYYTNAVGSILAERQHERPNCLAKALLDRWARIREIVWAIETDEQRRYANKLLKYAAATADSLLEGNSDAAYWTLQALNEQLEAATE